MSAGTIEAPTVIRRTKEKDSRAVPIQQAPDRVIPPLGQVEALVKSWLGGDTAILPVDGPLHPDYFEALQFNEEPVKILIHRSNEKNPPICTDYIAINGIAAEMLFRNGWVPIGYLPRGFAIITKRKYVGVLASSKQDTIRTDVTERPNEDPVNRVERSTIQTMSFSVLEDRNPKGQVWLERLINQRG